MPNKLQKPCRAEVGGFKKVAGQLIIGQEFDNDAGGCRFLWKRHSKWGQLRDR